MCIKQTKARMSEWLIRYSFVWALQVIRWIIRNSLEPEAGTSNNLKEEKAEPEDINYPKKQPAAKTELKHHPLLHLLIWTEILWPDLSIPGLLVATTWGVLMGRLLLHCQRRILLLPSVRLISSTGGRHHLPVFQAVGSLQKNRINMGYLTHMRNGKKLQVDTML